MLGTLAGLTAGSPLAEGRDALTAGEELVFYVDAEAVEDDHGEQEV